MSKSTKTTKPIQGSANLNEMQKPGLLNKSTSLKPSIPVRQTLTSKLRTDRLLNLKTKLESLKEKRNTTLNRDTVSSSKESLASVDNKFKKPFSAVPVQNQKTPLLKNPTKILNSTTKSATLKIPQNAPKIIAKTENTKPQKNTTNKIATSTPFISKFNNFNKKTIPNGDTAKNKTLNKPTVTVKKIDTKKPVTNNLASKPQPTMRKSLTAIHFKRVTNCNRLSTIHRAKSCMNVSNSKINPDVMSPIQEYAEKVEFKTPSMAKRRSIAFQTPMSSTKDFISPWTEKSTPTANDLKKRLSLWLERKGKPLGAFHHLRCFGINNIKTEIIAEENKENIEITTNEKTPSYEDLKIPQEDIKSKILIANDALYDLHKLIQEGYPRDQCEAWLKIILSNIEQIEEKPQYWECKAALEEARGEFSNAVDCYRTAIIKGAEVKTVDESLESLLQKFSVLNITPSKEASSSNSKMVLDARNIFKSSIINFAIHERTKSDGDCQFVATPVRRSTRMSRTRYTSTPGVQICSTLGNLDS